MAEGDITNPVMELDQLGQDITVEADQGIAPGATQNMDEDQASLKAFAYSELAFGGSTADKKNEEYIRVRDSLIQLGSDPVLEDYEENLTNISQMTFSDQQLDAIAEGRFGPKDAIPAIQEAIRAGHMPVEDALLIQIGEKADQETELLLDEPNSVGEFSYGAWVAERNTERDAVDAVLSPIIADMDPAFGSLLIDFFAEAAIPFALSTFAAKLASDLEGFQGGSFTDRLVARIRGFVAPGEVRNDIRLFISSVSPEQRPEMARQIAQLIRENSGLILDNDTETIDWIETVVSSADEDRSGFDWDRTLYNMITLLDALPFISAIATGGIKAGHNFFSAAGRANRLRARKFLKEQMDNPNSKRGLVIPLEDIATGQLPKTTLDDLNSTPQVISDDLAPVFQGAAQVVRTADNTAINYTAGEVSGLAERLSSAYQSLRGGVLNINKFVLDLTQGDRIITQAFYSRTKNEAGWKSLKSTLTAALKLTDGDLAGVRVLVRNTDGGFDPVVTGKELRKRAAKLGAKPDGNEYFIQIRDTHFLSEADVMAFGGNPVFFTGPFGSGRWLGDASAQFSEEVWKPAYLALSREKIFQQEALRLAKQFWDLPRAGRNRVTRLLDQSAKDKRVYTPTELVEKSDSIEGGISKLTVGEMKAYYAFRAANDAVWATANQTAFKQMTTAGFRTFGRVDGTVTWITRPLRSKDGTVKRAYNPKTDSIEDVTPVLREQMDKKGGGIEVLHKNDPIVRGTESTSFIIRDGGPTTELSRLPIHVLKYEEAYLSRSYKDQFMIVAQKSITRNGVATTDDQVVFTARTKGEADAQAARLTEETGVPHVSKDVVVDDNYSKILNDTMLLEQDRLVFGPRRSEPLTNALTGEARLADPVEALDRSIKAVGRSIGIEEYVKVQEMKFIQTFGDIIDKKTWLAYQQSRFGPRAITDHLKALKKQGEPIRRKAQEALQLWNYYQMLRGTAEPIITREFRAGIRSLAFKVEQMTGAKSVAEFLNNVSRFESGPLGVAKGLVFTTLIAANPFRQYALQSAQYAFMLGVNPRIAISALRHAQTVRIGLNTIDTPNWEGWRKSIAVVLRMSEDEVEIMVRQFKSSGLVAELNSYGYVGAQITDPSMTYRPGIISGGVQSIGNIVGAPFRLAKKVGFEWGEMNNLSATWTFSLKQYLRANKKRVSDLTPKEWQDIGAQASGYALGMHKAGTMAYQQGLVSLLTQFWSIQHKALQAMIPGRYGSKAFTGSQKAGIAAVQFGFYGAAGLGIEELVRDIMAQTGVLDDVPQEKANNIVRVIGTGVGEMVLNHVLTEENEERVDLSFSSSFAPAGAPVSTVTDFLMAMINFNTLDSLMRQTAGGSTLGRYTDMARYLHYTLAISDTLPDTPDKLERVLTIAPTVFSGYNNAMKAFYAMRTGQLVTRFGDHRTHITYSEAVLKGLFGIETHEEADLRRIYNLDGKGFSFDEKMADDIARNVYRAMNLNLLAFEGRGDNDFTRMAAAYEGERLILEILNDDEKEQVRLAFNKLALKRRGKPDDVFLRLHTAAFQGQVPIERMYSEVRTNLFAEKYNEQRDSLLRQIQQMVEGRNERTEWYLDQNLRRFDENRFNLEEE